MFFVINEPWCRKRILTGLKYGTCEAEKIAKIK